MIEVQCTSCHTRYRIDEQVLPDGTPTFKCSRCGHVFTFEPRKSKPTPAATPSPPKSPSSEPPVAARAAEPEPRLEPKAVPAPPPPVVNQASEAIAPPTPSKPAEEPPPAPSLETPSAVSENKPVEKVAAPSEIEQSTAPPSATLAAPSQTGRTAEFLSRPFGASADDLTTAGENLTFDFNDEEPATIDAAGDSDPLVESSRWEVGETPAAPLEPVRVSSRGRANPALARPPRRGPRVIKPADVDAFIDDADAPVYNRGLTHSAQFFLLMFLLVAIGFGATALLIHEAPATAAEILNRLPMVGSRFISPTTPARMVALREVHANYQRARNGATALVITGTAENVGTTPLHVVQIAVNLRDQSQRALAAGSVYCGNSNLAPAMVTTMTPHEIEFFQKLHPPGNFTLYPSATAPFVVIFMNPPATVSRYDVAVAQATAAADENEAPPAS